MNETENWIDKFPGLSQLGADLRAQLSKKSRIANFPKGAVIFGPGKAAENLLLLLKGTVRVQQVSENGREIVLYRVHAGESCVLTTACLLAYENYSAEGIVETDIQVAAIPRLVFDELISQSEAFRSFVFSAYSKRMTDLFFVIEEIAFQRVDVRLAQKLLELQEPVGCVKSTHQKLATELGSAREVISRQLQEFQRRGWIAQSRGTITLLQAESIQKLASTSI